MASKKNPVNLKSPAYAKRVSREKRAASLNNVDKYLVPLTGPGVFAIIAVILRNTASFSRETVTLIAAPVGAVVTFAVSRFRRRKAARSEPKL